MRYEVIREIFNQCSGNQMRDVFVTTEEVSDPESYVRNMLVGNIEVFEVSRQGGDVIISVVVDGLKQRFSFTED